MTNKKITIIGASPKPDRYSHKLLKMAVANEFEPILIHPIHSEIEGHTVYSKIPESAEGSIVTLYVNAKASQNLLEDIVAVKPKLVLFNPGAENSELMADLEDAGIECESAKCMEASFVF
ncbi:CoA-binding protein [Fibrobacterales bacterium]|nr:CoA-binding protein [Fibrobacterales bacterium]